MIIKKIEIKKYFKKIEKLFLNLSKKNFNGNQLYGCENLKKIKKIKE